MGHVGFGFAAGCEAVTMPRRQQPDYSPGYARFGLARSDLLGQGRIKGIALTCEKPLRRGIATASHPGAKPKRHQRRTFRARLRSECASDKDRTAAVQTEKISGHGDSGKA